MKYYFDENFPPQIAKALQILQSPKMEENVEVLNISDVFGKGASDEEWIPEIALQEGTVVTQDLNIHQTRNQRELYRSHKLGVVFLKPPSKRGYSYWELVEKIFASWFEIKKTTNTAKRPFAYIIRARSKRLEEL